MARRMRMRDAILAIFVQFTLFVPLTRADSPGDLVRVYYEPDPYVYPNNFGFPILGIGNDILAVDQYRPLPGGHPYDGAAYFFNGETGQYRRITGPTDAGYFGSAAAAIDGQVLLGTNSYHFSQYRNGAVWRYQPQTGQVLQTILDPPRPNNSFQRSFGTAVVAVGDYIAVSDTDANQSYVFLFDAISGAMVRQIPNPFPVFGRRFGNDLAAVGGDRLLVGASDSSSNDPNQVYLYNVHTGDLLVTFNHPSSTPLPGFGSSLVADEKTVGISGNIDETRSGIHLFSANTGEYLRTLANIRPVVPDNFGAAMALSGNHVVVGSYNYSSPSFSEVGRVYVFDVKSGAVIQTIEHPDPRNNGRFGRSVAALDNGDIVVNSYDESRLPNGPGVLYRFRGLDPALDTIAYTNFDEATVGTVEYIASSMSNEIGFHTQWGVQGTDTIVGVRATSSTATTPIFGHQSAVAQTTTDVVDLSQWRDVRVSLLAQVRQTEYEASDFFRAYATNGTESVYLIQATGGMSGTLNELAGEGYRVFAADLPNSWDQAFSVVTSSSNSSTGAERYDFDSIVFQGVRLPVPEPSTVISLFLGVNCWFLMSRLGKRKNPRRGLTDDFNGPSSQHSEVFVLK